MLQTFETFRYKLANICCSNVINHDKSAPGKRYRSYSFERRPRKNAALAINFF